jgi:hypothetical protein
MTIHEARQQHPRQGRVDFTMMYAAHDAFQRDLHRLTAALQAGRAADPATRTGWATFKKQLHVHHTVEDVALWPALRQKVTGPAQVAVLDAMEAEHARIDPLLDRVDTAFLASHSRGLAETAGELALALVTHMKHEEEDALPLVEEYLGPEGWHGFGDAMRKKQGMKGAAEFFPWMLDSASAGISKQVLGALPVPARLLYRVLWRPSYARTPRWKSTRGSFG